MGVVGLMAETVEEEELGIFLNATKVTITIIWMTNIIEGEVEMNDLFNKVGVNISSNAIEMANSSKEYEEDLYRSKQHYLATSIATNVLWGRSSPFPRIIV